LDRSGDFFSVSQMDDSGYDNSDERTTATPGVKPNLSDVDHPMTGLQRREVFTTASDLVTDTRFVFSFLSYLKLIAQRL